MKFSASFLYALSGSSSLLASLPIVSAIASAKSPKTTKSSKEEDTIPWDIYGNAQVFQPSNTVEVDSNCEYTAILEVNIRDAGLSIPNLATDCSPEVANCVNHKGEAVSCLNEQRNLYEISNMFRDHTGFNHVSFDYSPCGHPPAGIFTIPHLNFHFFRATPREREIATCTMIPGTPICDFPGSGSPRPVQSTPSGRAYFVQSHDLDTNKVANMPSTFSSDLATAVPGEGVHAWDFDKVTNQNNWTEPILILGTYNGNIRFWEPMVPVTFHIGSQNEFYEENVTYVAQTIIELPSFYSVVYNAASGLTTLTIKGKSAVCKV